MKVPAHHDGRPPGRDDWLDLPADEAEQGLNERVARARQADEPQLLAQGLLWLGRVLAPQGRENAAAAALDEAKLLADQLRDDALAAQIGISQAWNDADFGHHARALAACRAVAEKARARGDDLALRQANFVTATTLVHLGEHDLAVEHFEEARVALLAQPGRLTDAEVRHRHGRYMAGLAQAWLMRAGLLQEAGGRQAATDAFERARQASERACEDLVDAVPRLSAPALFGLQRVLLEAGEVDAARGWMQRVASAAPGGAPPDSIAFAQQTLGRAMVDLRASDVDAGSIIQGLEALQSVRHPRVVAGDLRLALLRCLYEACEQDGRYEQALQYQQQWGETKARIRGRVAAEHGQWTTQTLTAWRNEADDVVKTALREPLRRAAQQLHALQGTAAMDPEATTSFARARHSVARAIDIADQYLGVMRAEHLRQEEMQAIDLSTLVEDVCEQTSPPQGASVKLALDIEPRVRVRGDRVLLMRALGNLLSNAFKHAPAETAVRVDLAQLGDEVRLRVSDKGPGMALDMRARLFQRFATGSVRKGNGLGLAMVARVARLHGARIEVDSEPGLGTEISLLLEGASGGE
jgi:signal transduction histidine kinase